MSLFARLFGTEPDPSEALRPLWHGIVGEARQPLWYRRMGVADTLEGRFDMITAIMALVILRMDNSPSLSPQTAYLTELFVSDMDGQLRESGIGDPTVGKYIGRLVSAMGGRIGAFREALASDDMGEGRTMGEVVAANMTLIDGTDPQPLGEKLTAFAHDIARLDDAALLQGRFSS